MKELQQMNFDKWPDWLGGDVEGYSKVENLSQTKSVYITHFL